MTTLYTKGFKVAGIVEHSNIYPKAKSKAEISLITLLDIDDADAWNTKLSLDDRPFNHDSEVCDTAQDQLQRNLLSEALTKQDLDNIFVKGRWRGIRRRGIGKTGKSAESITREHPALILQLGSKTPS